MKLLSNLPDRSKNDSSLGMEILGTSKPALSSLVAARLLDYTVTMVARLLVFKATMELGRGDGIKAN